MPVLPPVPAAVYDSVTDVLNVARTRLNDEVTTLLPIRGQLLNNNQIFTQQMMNNAWRKAQEYLGERGYARLLNEAIFTGLPVVGSLDPASQTWLSWTGYFDGANLFQNWFLPSDFSHPLKMWERWSGQAAQFCDPPMEKMLDGLPALVKTTSIRFWEWRGDAIYMPGSTISEDLRIRYVKFLPDFTDVGSTLWYEQPVPMVRVTDPLSWLICAEVAIARGDTALTDLLTERGHQGLSRVFNLDVRADQRVNIRRRPLSGRGYLSRNQW